MAHSLQNRSPCEQHTGSTDGSRHSWHEPKGKNESLVSRVACEPHLSFSAFRSYDVNTDFGGGMLVSQLRLHNGQLCGELLVREQRYDARDSRRR
jgi:hypothetical protein